MTVALDPGPQRESQQPKALLQGRRGWVDQVLVVIFLTLPLLALTVAVPVAWGWGLGWVELGVGAAFYVVSGLGVTVGFHRYLTHGSFKTNRFLRAVLAIAGSLSLQGSVTEWVANHRRHHAFSDKEGDPHSPWLHGRSPVALVKGFTHAHLGWLYKRDRTNQERFAPDLTADPVIAGVNRHFPLLTVASLVLPAVLGGVLTWSWWGALTTFFWAGLVRVGLLYHVTFSVNSLCHMIGKRPFVTRDRSTNVWMLAVLSFGESWHNLHHADPTCARHGVRRGQVDISARLIWLFEKFGWVRDVRWPTSARLARLAV